VRRKSNKFKCRCGFQQGQSLVNQSFRISTAETLEPSTVFRIEKRAMLRSLHEQRELSEKFMASLLTRNIDLEEDRCDQLFNHSEKRLARVLLKLARLRENDVAADASIPVLSHETLAEMVGTTRSRITHFMNKFSAYSQRSGGPGGEGTPYISRVRRRTIFDSLQPDRRTARRGPDLSSLLESFR
jgi:Crp-like helix-turn-helix domain